MNSLKYIIFGLLLFSITACESKPDIIKDISSESYPLIDADSSTVTFPDDFEGSITAVTFIYTHCPDICPIITSNMKKIQAELSDTSNIHFVEITFDPQRDTPSVLADYRELYHLNDQFSLLTGEQANINSLLSSLDIKYKKIMNNSADTSSYEMMHSNTAYLIDKEGRIRFEYRANTMQPAEVARDIQKLRQ